MLFGRMPSPEHCSKQDDTAQNRMMKTADSNLKAKTVLWSKKLAKQAAQFDAQRQLSPDTARALAQDGFFRMLVPEVYGGLEVHPWTMVECLKHLAIGDASASWNVMIGATTGVLSASLPAAAAKRIYADDPDVLTVGVTAPSGRAEAAEDGGGFVVSGRWPFGSGCQNAQWICGGCFLFDHQGHPMTDAEGRPQVGLMMFQAEQITIEDTWDVLGLRGTGSHHFHVDKAFVPKGYHVILGRRPLIRRPLYQFPTLGLLALGIASVALGVGQKALQSFIRLATEKKPTGSGKTLADRALVQSSIAQSTASLRSAEALIKEVIDAAWEKALEAKGLAVRQKADLRLAAANATHSAKDVVDQLYELSGGSAVYVDNPLHKCFRDIHMITQHMMVAQPIYEVTGRVYLGLPPRSPL